jgi:hypothetical protein
VKKDGKIRKRKRYAFNGTRIDISHYDKKDVSVYYKKGSQGAVKYTY